MPRVSPPRDSFRPDGCLEHEGRSSGALDSITSDNLSSLNIFLLSDLHLPLARRVSMHFFGKRWDDHLSGMTHAWDECVGPDDVVLVPGDISWAPTPTSMKRDLEWLDDRPGKKVLSRGNHDRWWRSPGHMSSFLPRSVDHIHDGCRRIGDGVAVAAMGGTCPGDRFFTSRHARRWPTVVAEVRERLEVLRALLDHSDAAFRLLMLHYPPFNGFGEASEITELIRDSPVDVVVYGHFHRPEEWSVTWNGEIDGTTYVFGAADAIGFAPRRVGWLDGGRFWADPSTAQTPSGARIQATGRDDSSTP